MPVVLVTGPTAMQNSIVFFSIAGCNRHQYALCLPTEGWPGWVDLFGWFTCPKAFTHSATNWSQHGGTLSIETSVFYHHHHQRVVFRDRSVPLLWPRRMEASQQVRDDIPVSYGIWEVHVFLERPCSLFQLVPGFRPVEIFVILMCRDSCVKSSDMTK